MLHVSVLSPANADGTGLIVRTISSVTDPHGTLPDAVKVSVTVPAEISEIPGVYSGFSKLISLKVPSPDVVHSTEK